VVVTPGLAGGTALPNLLSWIWGMLHSRLRGKERIRRAGKEMNGTREGWERKMIRKGAR